jgi:outer membrane lipoprotein carrier protein
VGIEEVGMKMKNKFLLLVLCGFLWGGLPMGVGAAEPAHAVKALSLNEILNRVEARYSGPGFSVQFAQTSTLKAMNISDSATGRILVKRPGLMRWEYEAPNVQLIIANPTDIWIYRPEDHQVMHGASPDFFKGGNGAGFLSNMTLLRQDFNASLESADPGTSYRIKLIPKKKTYNVAEIYLTVSAKDFEITALSTLNPYGDDTRFDLSHYAFDQKFSAGLFKFKIPEGTEVLSLDK